MKELRYKYLLDKFPDTEENMVKKYWADYTKRAHFVSVNLYKWRTVYASEPRELWLCGVLTLEGIKYEHD
jgi:hypothetical protein